MLQRLYEGLTEMKDELAEAHRQDLGINTFMYELIHHSVTINEVKDLHHNVESWSKEERIPTPMTIGMASCSVVHEPLGVVLVLSAWNYPLYTAIPLVAAAISAGNAVILKPSEIAPYTSNVLSKLFKKYLDDCFYRVIEGQV